MLLTILYLLSALLPNAATVAPVGLASEPDGSISLSVRWSGMSADGHLSVFTFADISAPGETVLTLDGRDLQGGRLLSRPDGSLHLFWTEAGKAWHRIRRDGCWGQPLPVGPGYVNSVPVIRPDGVWVLAADAEDGAFVYLSTDGGDSWTAGKGRLTVPQKMDTIARCPQAFVGPDGKLRMMLSGFRTGFCYLSQSEDGGESWGLPRRCVHGTDTPWSLTPLSDGSVYYLKNCRIDEVEFVREEELWGYRSTTGADAFRPGSRIASRKFCTDPVCCEGPDGTLLAAWKQSYNGSCRISLATVTNGKAGQERTLLEAPLARQAYVASCGGLLTPRTDYYAQSVRIMSYNTLRSEWDGGREKWLPRLKTIFEHIKKWNPDIIGMQETSQSDIADLKKQLGKNYDYVAITPGFFGPAVPPERETSELPLWWRKKRFTLVSQGWEDFNIVNDIRCGVNASDESWGNGQDRNKAVVWAILKDNKTGGEILLVNTHLPTRTEPSKLGAIKVIEELVKRKAEGRPVFITGDYNSNESGPLFLYLQQDVEYLTDAGLALPPEKRLDWDYMSYGTLKPESEKVRNSQHIDHIFYTQANSVPLFWATDWHAGRNGSPGSDHHPIIVDFKYARQ